MKFNFKEFFSGLIIFCIFCFGTYFGIAFFQEPRWSSVQTLDIIIMLSLGILFNIFKALDLGLNNKNTNKEDTLLPPVNIVEKKK